MSIDFDPTRRVRRDPGPNNVAFFGFGRGEKPDTDEPETHLISFLKTRPGCTERDMHVESTAAGVTPMRFQISLNGWYTDRLLLNERQVRHLHQILDAHLRLHDDIIASIDTAG